MNRGVRPKVCFVIPDQFGYAAGYYQYAKYLSEYGFGVTVLSVDKGLPRIEEIPDVTIKYLTINEKSVFSNTISYIRKSNRYLNTLDINTIVILKYIPFISVLLLSLRRKKRVFLDIRTGAVNKSRVKSILLNALLTFESYFFSRIYILSLELARILHLNMKKVVYLPLGADVYSVQPKSYENDFNLLYVGTFNFRRIYDTIYGLKMFCDKYASHLRITYTIIGYGDEDEIRKIKNAINTCHLNDYVDYVGRKTYTEFSPYFDKANIGIAYVPMVKYYNNQPPTKVFEYALSGLICLATNTDANIQLICSKNGVLCNDSPDAFFLALEKLYKERSRFVFTDITQSMEQYSWKNIVREVIIPSLKG